MAILTFGPMIAIAGEYYFKIGISSWIDAFAILGILGSIATLFTTSMIYASLKAIPAWHNKWVIVGYQVYALSSGGVAYIMIAGWQHYMTVVYF